MVLTGELSTRVRGPRRKNLLIAAALAVAVLAGAAWVLIAKFNDRPVWPEDIAYEAGYHQGQQVRKMDRNGVRVREANAGGCASWVANGGEKADLSPDSWVRGCLDAVNARPSNPKNV